MPTNCFFKFSRGNPIYYSGEHICGCVTFVTSKLIQVELLTLNLMGCYEAQWNETAQATFMEHCDGKQNDHRINYNTSKLFLNESIKLLEKVELKPGAHNYDISFRLPQNSPPTMKQYFGEVAYDIQLILERQSKQSKIFKQRIILKPLLDLNDMNANPLREKILLEGHHQLYISSPQTTYVPGQPISISVKYDSLPATITQMKMSLLQSITFKSFEQSVHNKQISKIIATNYWKINESQPYLMPPLTIPMTTLNNEWPIQVSYNLEFSLLNHKNKILIKVFKPIIIGTIALKSTKNLYSMNELPTPYCFDNLGSSVIEIENNIQNNVWQTHAIEDRIHFCMNISDSSHKMVNCERTSLLM